MLRLDVQSQWGLEEHDGLGDEAPAGPEVPDGAVAAVIVMQPDGSPCVGWLMAHPNVANVSSTKRRALVQLNVLHAHDLELQTCIATDDERIVAAMRRGDLQRNRGTGTGAPPNAPAAVYEPPAGGTGEVASGGGLDGGGSGGAAGGSDWLSEMRARDAALQARIAQGDAAVFGMS